MVGWFLQGTRPRQTDGHYIDLRKKVPLKNWTRRGNNEGNMETYI